MLILSPVTPLSACMSIPATRSPAQRPTYAIIQVPPPLWFKQTAGLHQDRDRAYELLLKRADGLSADARELNAETH